MCLDDSSAPAPSEPPKSVTQFYDFLRTVGADQYQYAKDTYRPLEKKVIDQAQQFNTPQFREQQATLAGADVSAEFDKARKANDFRLSSFGIDPGQGAGRSSALGMDAAQAAATAGAKTGARTNALYTGYNINAGLAGRGDAKVNQAIAAGSAGGSLATNAYGIGQQAATQANAQSNAGMAGIGQLAGTVGTLAFLASSPKFKKVGKRFKGGLAAVDKMPVSHYRYKPGLGDSGAAPHVGMMADDFKRATGHGDGETINVGDALGVHTAAIQELHKKVRGLTPHDSDPESEANQPEGATA